MSLDGRVVVLPLVDPLAGAFQRFRPPRPGVIGESDLEVPSPAWDPFHQHGHRIGVRRLTHRTGFSPVGAGIRRRVPSLGSRCLRQIAFPQGVLVARLGSAPCAATPRTRRTSASGYSLDSAPTQSRAPLTLRRATTPRGTREVPQTASGSSVSCPGLGASKLSLPSKTQRGEAVTEGSLPPSPQHHHRFGGRTTTRPQVFLLPIGVPEQPNGEPHAVVGHPWQPIQESPLDDEPVPEERECPPRSRGHAVEPRLGRVELGVADLVPHPVPKRLAGLVDQRSPKAHGRPRHPDLLVEARRPVLGETDERVIPPDQTQEPPTPHPAPAQGP